MRNYVFGQAENGVGKKAATADRALGHGLVNMMLPPTVLATIAHYDPKVVAAVVGFFEKNILGKHAVSLFPLLNLCITLLATSAEFGVRQAAGSQGKDDVLVHTPFPGVRGFARKEAIVGMFVMFMMQTLNGLLAENAPDSSAAKNLDIMYRDPIFCFLGQMAIMVLATKLVEGLVTGASKLAACAGISLFASAAPAPANEGARLLIDQDQNQDQDGTTYVSLPRSPLGGGASSSV